MLLQGDEGDGRGSLFCCSNWRQLSCFRAVEFVLRKRGSRSISATRLSTAGRFSRCRLDAKRTRRPARRKRLTCAFSRSNSSLICWRVCFAVPRFSIAAVKLRCRRPVLQFLVTKAQRQMRRARYCRASSSATGRASCRPSRSVGPRFEFASDGSNASPAAIVASPL